MRKSIYIVAFIVMSLSIITMSSFHVPGRHESGATSRGAAADRKTSPRGRGRRQVLPARSIKSWKSFSTPTRPGRPAATDAARRRLTKTWRTDNAADIYRELAEMINEDESGVLPRIIQLMNKGYDQLDDTGKSELATLTAFPELAEALELMKMAAEKPRCDFELDFSNGMFNVLLPHLNWGRSMISLAMAKASVEQEFGHDSNAMDALALALKTSAAITQQDPFLISRLVKLSCDRQVISMLEKTLEERAWTEHLDPEITAELRKRRYAEEMAEALRHEGEMARNTIGEEEFWSFYQQSINHLFPAETPVDDRGEPLPVDDQITKELGACFDQLFNESHDPAVALRWVKQQAKQYPVETRRALMEFQDRIRSMSSFEENLTMLFKLQNRAADIMEQPFDQRSVKKLNDLKMEVQSLPLKYAFVKNFFMDCANLAAKVNETNKRLNQLVDQNLDQEM